MPFTKGANNATGPYISGGTQTYQQANNAEYQFDEAIQSLEQHLLTAFVITGGVCTIHGGLPKQLDFTAIDAFLKQPVDSSGQTNLRWRHVAAGNFTSATASSTYFLDLNPDGTMNWATTHSGQANYLPICSVTTDGSQNLVTITDARPINTTLLAAMVGILNLPAGSIAAPQVTAGAFVAGVTIPATQVTAGALPSGVTSPNYVAKSGDTMTGALTSTAFHGPADSLSAVNGTVIAGDDGTTVTLQPSSGFGASSRQLALGARDSGGTVRTGAFVATADGLFSFVTRDTSAGNMKFIREFVGTTDPTGYTTANEGDVWVKGAWLNPFRAIFGRGRCSVSSSYRPHMPLPAFSSTSALSDITLIGT